jgi:hypothetical protein
MRIFRRRWTWVRALLAALSGVVLASCLNAAEPKIDSITPSVISVGETRSLKIVGEGLSSLRDLVFYQEGLECGDIQTDGDFAATATIRVIDGTKPGSVPFRLLTDSGFSNVKTLRLTDLPLMIEPDRKADSESVGIECGAGLAIYGTLKSGEYDRYALHLEADESCTAVVDAVRLGGLLLDTILKVYDPSGSMIASVDDTSLYRQDPFLQFTAKVAGEYVIEVHECNYDGGEDSHYVLYVGDMPAPAVVFPPGGHVGQALQVVTIPENGVRSPTYQLPPLEAGEDGWMEHRLDHQGKRSPTAVRLRASPFPNVLEAGDNESAKSVLDRVSNVPIAFCGIIERSGDIDCFAFEAEAGKAIRFESFAERVGAPLDSIVSIIDREGVELVSGDDWMCHDSLVDFKPKYSGIYVLRVADKLGKGSADSVYRVEASFLEPKATVFLPRPDRASQTGQSIAVPLGNRAVANIGIRRDFVDGDASLAFENLPAGVTAPTWQIPSDQFWMPVVLSASEDAKFGGAMVQIRGTIRSGEGVVEGGFAQAIDLVAESADRLFHGVQVDRVPVAVVDPVPFRVELEAPESELAVGGTLAITIRVIREPGFTEPVLIKVPFLPPWVTCESEALVPVGVDEIQHELKAYRQADSRTWPMVVTAEVDARKASGDVSKLRGRQVASQLVPLTIAPSPISGRFEPIAAEQGETVEMKCLCNVSGVIAQPLTATLEGLPNRVTSNPVMLTGDVSEVTFDLKVADDAPIGTFGSVRCRLSGVLNGQSVSYVIAHETPLQIAAVGKLARGSSGEVLSPLEALQQKKSRP